MTRDPAARLKTPLVVALAAGSAAARRGLVAAVTMTGRDEVLEILNDIRSQTP